MADKGLCLREATAGDYQAVLDIDREVYQGFDYLASVYFELIHDKFTHLFVGEVGSEMVAFVALRLIKNYTVAVSVAMRTSKRFRGRGIAAPFKAMTLNEIKRKFPKIRELLAAVPTGTFPEYWDKVLADSSQQDNILLKWRFLAYIMDTSRLEGILYAHMSDPAKDGIIVERAGSSMDTDDIRRMMELLREEGDYFHHDYWVLQPITESSTSYVTKTSHVYVTRGGGGVITAVTHASIVPVDSSALRLDIWFHGSSRETFFAHCLAVLKDTVSVMGPRARTLRIILNYPAAMGDNRVEADLAPLLGLTYSMPPTFGRTLAVIHKSQL